MTKKVKIRNDKKTGTKITTTVPKNCKNYKIKVVVTTEKNGISESEKVKVEVKKKFDYATRKDSN